MRAWSKNVSKTSALVESTCMLCRARSARSSDWVGTDPPSDGSFPAETTSRAGEIGQAVSMHTRQRAGDHSSAVLAALDAVSPDRLTALVQELVRIPSVTGSAAEGDAQHALAARLVAAGF